MLNADVLEQALDAVWPAANKDAGNEDYARLLEQLKHFAINTSGDLKRLLTKHKEATIDEDREQVRLAQLREAAPSPRVTAGVYFKHTGLTRRALAHEFGDEWEDFLAAEWAKLQDASSLNA